MTVKVHGKPNYQRLAETWLSILAARDGLEVVPGSVRVELNPKGNGKAESEGNRVDQKEYN